MKNLIKQFFKFGIVGCINTFSSWLFYYSFLFLHVNYLVATTIAYVLSSIIGYTLNKIWVFKKKQSKVTDSIFKYIVVYGSSYLINIGCMYLFVDILGLSELIAPVLTLCVTVPYNFIFSRLWVFREKENIYLKNPEKYHTFAICAYKESEHLETLIQSLMSQTVKTTVYISTSTPNDYISKLAKKYNLEVYPTGAKSDIQDDWNAAYNRAKTPLVTVAHQDDYYEETYAEEILKKFHKCPKASIFITDYHPLKNGKIAKDKNCKIKKLLKTCLRSSFLAKFRFFKVSALSLGNSICCPSVTYHKELLGNTIFTSDLKFALDWDTFLKIARMKGTFAYIPKYLIRYRVYDGATTKEFIVNHKREQEDIIMFNKIWPKWVTKIIMKAYVGAYDTYK